MRACHLEGVTRRRKYKTTIRDGSGRQYTSIHFGLRCKEAGVRPSMGSVGDAYDNAMAESFFATLECELLDRRRFKSQAEARMAVFESSRAGTTRGAAIQPWSTSHRSVTKGSTTKALRRKPRTIHRTGQLQSEICAVGENRTPTSFRPPEPESGASTSSATTAWKGELREAVTERQECP
jgi:hypothetical protein